MGASCSFGTTEMRLMPDLFALAQYNWSFGQKGSPESPARSRVASGMRRGTFARVGQRARPLAAGCGASGLGSGFGRLADAIGPQGSFEGFALAGLTLRPRL